MSLVASTGGFTMLPLYVQNALIPSVVARPLRGEVPTIGLMMGKLVGTTSPAQSITLSNYGTTTLSIAGIAATTNFGEIDTCGTSLTSGANCTINVTFTPSASGSLNGTLSVTDNAPGSPQTVSLSGTGMVVSDQTLLCRQPVCCLPAET